MNNERARETPRKHLSHMTLSMNAPSIDELLEKSPSSGLARPTRPTLLARIAAEEAWSSAGEMSGIDSERAGMLVNRNFGQHQMIGQYYETLWTKGPSGVSGLQFVQTIANSVLGSLAMHFKLRGPSSMQFGPPSIGAAFDLLRSDHADMMLAVGMDELSDYVLELCHQSKLSRCPASSEGTSKPYHPESRSLVPSEGSICFVLEQQASAVSRSIDPLAYLRGFATVTDSFAWRNPAERNSDDIAEAILRSLADARVTADEISFVSGAANGIPAMDQAEREAIAIVFPHQPPIFSVKDGLGETWGASGGFSLLAAVLAIQHKTLPPTVVGSRAVNSIEDKTSIVGSAKYSGHIGLALSMEMSGQNSAFVVGGQP
jgi:3-oxoacyl-[acyl-carrier-protein] synthase II